MYWCCGIFSSAAMIQRCSACLLCEDNETSYTGTHEDDTSCVRVRGIQDDLPVHRVEVVADLCEERCRHRSTIRVVGKYQSDDIFQTFPQLV